MRTLIVVALLLAPAAAHAQALTAAVSGRPLSSIFPISPIRIAAPAAKPWCGSRKRRSTGGSRSPGQATSPPIRRGISGTSATSAGSRARQQFMSHSGAMSDSTRPRSRSFSERHHGAAVLYDQREVSSETNPRHRVRAAARSFRENRGGDTIPGLRSGLRCKSAEAGTYADRAASRVREPMPSIWKNATKAIVTGMHHQRI